MTILPLATLFSLCDKAGFTSDGDIEMLAKGWWSSAYDFSHRGRKYVLRVSNDDVDFKKDKIVSQLLKGSGLPVPDVMALGSDATLHYAISQRCKGYVMTDENVDEEDVLRLYDCLWQMQQYEMSHLPGWKQIDNEGGETSWVDGLLNFSNRKMDYTLEGLISSGRLQKEVVERATQNIRLLAPFCQTKKCLVHGDFGFDNALTNGETITGIIDWAEARAGDFLYDVAYLIFNASFIDYKKVWLQFLNEKRVTLENMTERLLCYQLVIGINSVAIAAHTGKEEAYATDLKKLINLL